MRTEEQDYDQYYGAKLIEGEEYQDFVVDVLWDLGIVVSLYTSKKYQMGKGEGRSAIEIKYDGRMAETGNVYIETAEKSDPKNMEYEPSGIYRDDNTLFYIIGDYSRVFMFSKKQLKQVEHRYKRVNKKTSRGFLIPVENAESIAAVVVNTNAEEHLT